VAITYIKDDLWRYLGIFREKVSPPHNVVRSVSHLKFNPCCKSRAYTHIAACYAVLLSSGTQLLGLTSDEYQQRDHQPHQVSLAARKKALASGPYCHCQHATWLTRASQSVNGMSDQASY